MVGVPDCVPAQCEPLNVSEYVCTAALLSLLAYLSLVPLGKERASNGTMCHPGTNKAITAFFSENRLGGHRHLSHTSLYSLAMYRVVFDLHRSRSYLQEVFFGKITSEH